MPQTLIFPSVRPSLRWLALIVVLVLVSSSLTSCGSGSAASHDSLKMASMEGMPADVHAAPVAVQEAYQFAVANPDVLQNLPCYCGCGDMGHTSNYACYVSGQNPDGAPVFDSHALGCSICVDITQDAMRLMREGKPLDEIRSYVDSTYAKYGPSNIP